MSQTRSKIISEYKLTEVGLLDLINDLSKKGETEHNTQLIKNSLAGLYSDQNSRHPHPSQRLATDLQTANYNDLAEKARLGRYEHDFAAQTKSQLIEPIKPTLQIQHSTLSIAFHSLFTPPGSTAKQAGEHILTPPVSHSRPKTPF